MSYQPKSTYQILETSGNEWKTPQGIPYKGSYILTSNGAYMGNDITKKGPELIKSFPSTFTTINNIQETMEVNEYFRLKPDTVKFIQLTKPIISTKTLPSKQDYKKGSYVRYFAKKVNSSVEYYEIDKKTYQSINASNPEYDFYSFRVDKLIWALDGDVIKANKSILLQKEKRFPNVSYLFPNLSEFVKPKSKPKSSKQTLSKITTKTQSRGTYHANKHTENDFSIAYKPPKQTQEALNELEENNIIISLPLNTPPPNTPPPSTPSYGGGSSGNSSGGGGGGY